MTTVLDRLRELEAKATRGPWATMKQWPREIVPLCDREKRLGASADPKQDREEYAHPIAEVRVAMSFPGFEHRRTDSVQASLDAAAIVEARNSLPDLLACAEALHEATTNGEWTEGEQRGDWAISKDVYETVRAVLEPLLKDAP